MIFIKIAGFELVNRKKNNNRKQSGKMQVRA